jgi:hypothetical protein
VPESTIPVNGEEIERLLRERLQGQARHLRVVIREGRIVLQGRTFSYYAKQLAQTVVLQTPGRTLLVNEIEVQSVTAEVNSDSEEVQ